MVFRKEVLAGCFTFVGNRKAIRFYNTPKLQRKQILNKNTTLL